MSVYMMRDSSYSRTLRSARHHGCAEQHGNEESSESLLQICAVLGSTNPTDGLSFLEVSISNYQGQGTPWLMQTAVRFGVFSAPLVVALKILACHLHQVDCFG